MWRLYVITSKARTDYNRRYLQDKEPVIWRKITSFFLSYFERFDSKELLCFLVCRGGFGLWLDADLYHGSSFSCPTFSSPSLSTHKDFIVQDVEVWTVQSWQITLKETLTALTEAEEPLDSEENVEFSHYWTEPDWTAANTCAHGSGEPTSSMKPFLTINGPAIVFMSDNSAPQVAGWSISGYCCFEWLAVYRLPCSESSQELKS